METFVIICLIVAAASFGLKLIGIPTSVDLIALGLLAATLSVLVPALS